MSATTTTIRAIAALFAIARVVGAAAHADEATTPDPYIVEIDVRPWIEALRSDDLFQIDPAIESLGALGDHAIPALRAALKIEGVQARINLVEVLRDIRTPATVAALVEAAADENEEVRRDAIEALGRLGDRRAQSTLEAALHDPSAKVSRAAVAACLAQCSSPAALRRLVEKSLEQRTALTAQTSLSRVAAANRDAGVEIRKLADELAIPVMEDSGNSQRFDAALMVAQTGNEAAIPVLRECIEQKTQPMMSVLCIRGLGTLGSERSIAALAEAARGDDDRLRRPAACKALATLADDRPSAREAYAACTAAKAREAGRHSPEK